MTISVVDALRVAITRCWVIDTNRYDFSDIRAVVHLTMRPNGTIAGALFERESLADRDPVFAYVLDTIRAALNACQPFRMLTDVDFEYWQRIELTFFPATGDVN